MEVENDELGVFRHVVLLDQVFSEAETSLGDDQSVNELSINKLENLLIEFKENRLFLSSPTPFTLHRARERLIINYQPRIGFSWGTSFFRRTCGAGTMYRDEEPIEKVYTNRYSDEEYMIALEKGNSCAGDEYMLTREKGNTSLASQVELVVKNHQRLVDRRVLDELIEKGEFDGSGNREELFLATLEGHAFGFFKHEEVSLFKEYRSEYEKKHADELAQLLSVEVVRVKKWGSLGEHDMLSRAYKDIALCTRYNELHTQKRSEWIITGEGLSSLRFFNLNGEMQCVNFYNRTLKERPITYGTHATLLPYEHMSVVKNKPVTVSKVSISYSGLRPK